MHSVEREARARIPLTDTLDRSFRLLLVLALALIARAATAQSRWTLSDSAGKRASPSWSGGVEAYQYFLGADSYLVLIAGADHRALHLEERFQYEALRTASTWLGWTRTFGKRPRFDVVPMAGVLLGDATGGAVGFEATISWTAFQLYDEAEYVFFARGGEANLLYNWFTGAWHATPWLDLGLSVQRTRTVGTSLVVDRGAFAAMSRGAVTLTVYGFGLVTGSSFAILALGIEY